MLRAAEQSLMMPRAFCRFQFDLRSFIIAFPTEVSLAITNVFPSLEKPPREIASSRHCVLAYRDARKSGP